MRICNQCGLEIDFAFSERTRKYYPVNKSGKPHFLTCGKPEIAQKAKSRQKTKTAVLQLDRRLDDLIADAD